MGWWQRLDRQGGGASPFDVIRMLADWLQRAVPTAHRARPHSNLPENSDYLAARSTASALLRAAAGLRT
eukprot:1377782-Prymnesium_polylepis.2